METKIVGFDAEELIEAIRKRKVVAFPTETVYGLGVIADSPRAYENLVEVKKRRPDKPFTLMLSSAEEIGKYAVIDEKTKRIIDEFMPGEITLAPSAERRRCVMDSAGFTLYRRSRQRKSGGFPNDRPGRRADAGDQRESFRRKDLRGF